MLTRALFRSLFDPRFDLPLPSGGRSHYMTSRMDYAFCNLIGAARAVQTLQPDPRACALVAVAPPDYTILLTTHTHARVRGQRCKHADRKSKQKQARDPSQRYTIDIIRTVILDILVRTCLFLGVRWSRSACWWHSPVQSE